MDINITYESVSQGLLNLKPDKACGPDKVSQVTQKCWPGIDSIDTFSLQLKCQKQQSTRPMEKCQRIVLVQERR